MQILLILLTCLVCVRGESKLVEWFSMLKSNTVKTHFSSYFHEWLVFKKDYGKVYGDIETEGSCYETFRVNLQYIEEHNNLYVLGHKSFYLGINEFADMGQCGSSWAFSTNFPCKYDRSKVVAHCTSFKTVTRGNEFALKLAVDSRGPVSVLLDASHLSFMLYKSGVYNEPACSKTLLDHAGLVVGYGTKACHGDYWIVKNSWGPLWEADGYIMMSRNMDNQCGIATAASFPF